MRPQGPKDAKLAPWSPCACSSPSSLRFSTAGRTVAGSLVKLGFGEVEDARIGKLIELQVKEYDEAHVKSMCDKLLANPVIENYRFEVVK